MTDAKMVTQDVIDGVVVASFFAWPDRPGWGEVLPEWIQAGPLRKAWGWIVQQLSHGGTPALPALCVADRDAGVAAMEAIGTYADYVMPPSELVPWVRAWVAQQQVEATLRRGLQKAEDPDPEDDVAAWTMAELEQLQGTAHPATGRTLADIGLAVEHEWYEGLNQGGRPVITLPWPGISAVTQGLRAGRLIVVAARPGVGKSTWAGNVIRHVAGGQRLPCVLVNYEMAEAELLHGWVAQVGSLNAALLHSGAVPIGPRATTPEEKALEKRLLQAVETVRRWPVQVVARPLTLTEIRETVAQTVARGQCECLVVDYLQLVPHTGLQGSTTDERIGEITRALKHTARQYAIPVVALSQLSRQGAKEGREPVLSDLRASGSIEQDADQVLFLHPDRQRKDRVRAILAKNRQGPTGRWDLEWDARALRFDRAFPAEEAQV